MLYQYIFVWALVFTAPLSILSKTRKKNYLTFELFTTSNGSVGLVASLKGRSFPFILSTTTTALIINESILRRWYFQRLMRQRPLSVSLRQLFYRSSLALLEDEKEMYLHSHINYLPDSLRYHMIKDVRSSHSVLGLGLKEGSNPLLKSLHQNLDIKEETVLLLYTSDLTIGQKMIIGVERKRLKQPLSWMWIKVSPSSLGWILPADTISFGKASHPINHIPLRLDIAQEVLALPDFIIKSIISELYADSIVCRQKKIFIDCTSRIKMHPALLPSLSIRMGQKMLSFPLSALTVIKSNLWKKSSFKILIRSSSEGSAALGRICLKNYFVMLDFEKGEVGFLPYYLGNKQQINYKYTSLALLDKIFVVSFAACIVIVSLFLRKVCTFRRNIDYFSIQLI